MRIDQMSNWRLQEAKRLIEAEQLERLKKAFLFRMDGWEMDLLPVEDDSIIQFSDVLDEYERRWDLGTFGMKRSRWNLEEEGQNEFQRQKELRGD